MTTAPRELRTIEACLDSVRDAGLTHLTIFAEPRSYLPSNRQGTLWIQNNQRLGPWNNFLHALGTLVRDVPDADCYLMLQDDVELSKGLAGWLSNNAAPIGLLSLYTYLKNHSPGVGWHRLSTPRKGYGALALVFPNHIARRFLEDVEPSKNCDEGQIDLKVAHWCATTDCPYWLHSPSFARHLGLTSTIYPGVREITPNRQCHTFCPNAADLP